jgi:hypothetical protein
MPKKAKWHKKRLVVVISPKPAPQPLKATQNHLIVHSKMAKGIRSKCKRASRSQRRNTLSIPVSEARTKKISEEFTKELKDKESCSSIVGLKASMNMGKSNDAEMAEEVEVETEEEKAEKAAAKAAKIKEKLLEVKKKGMRGRANPGKQMSWF